MRRLEGLEWNKKKKKGHRKLRVKPALWAPGRGKSLPARGKSEGPLISIDPLGTRDLNRDRSRGEGSKENLATKKEKSYPLGTTALKGVQTP